MIGIYRQNPALAGLWLIGALLSTAIALFSYRYVIGIGPLAPTIVTNFFARPWLAIHAAGAATALLLAPVQMLPRLRAAVPAAHRWIGRLYIVCCLTGGAAGVFLAIGSTAGPVATAGFGALALAWIGANVMGWRAARRRSFVAHRRWMIRSFALTFAAVTLRLYTMSLPLLPFDFDDGYRAISFLCWVPNLIVAEFLVRRPAMDVARSSYQRLAETPLR